MDLTGFAAFTGAANQEWVPAQRRQTQLQSEQLDLQQKQAEMDGLSLLSQAFGGPPAPPTPVGQPAPQQAGPSSQPSPFGPPPPQPNPGGPPPAAPPSAPPPGPSAANGGPPGPAAQPGPSPAPAAAPTPRPQAPVMPTPGGVTPPRPAPSMGGGPGTQQPAIPGQMSADQLAAKIKAANPRVNWNDPRAGRALIAAMERAQHFLAPDAKLELMQAKMGLEYDAKIQKIQSDADAKLRTAQTQVQVAEIKAAAAQQVADIARERATAVAQIGAGSREKVAETGATSREKVAETNVVGRKELEAQKQQGKLDIEGVKAGYREKLEATKASLAAGKPLSDVEKKFYGGALLAGDHTTISYILGFSRNRQEIMRQVLEGAQAIDPSFTGKKAAAAVAQFAGQKAGATSIGRTAAMAAVGGAEIEQTLPLAAEASKKVDLERFPTVNSLELAAKYYVGKPDQQAAVTQLRQYVQSMQNAYRLVMARGGRSTVFDAKQAAELLNGNMPLSTLLAAGDAMKKEAAVVRKAVDQAMREVTGGGSAPAGGTAPSGDEDVDHSNPLLKD